MTWQRVYVSPFAYELPVFRFHEQRAKCESCAHLLATYSAENNGSRTRVMHCKTLRNVCSAQRLPGASCGPDAAEWEPKK